MVLGIASMASSGMLSASEEAMSPTAAYTAVRARQGPEGDDMISEQPKRLLIAQVSHELSAHQTYMGIALHFERASLKGWAKFFRDQATEEAGHAWKIMTFLIDNEIEFSLPQVGSAPTTYASARDAVETALTSEQRVTAQFEALANAALDAKDNRTLQFVQWFIEEQVEEERTMMSLLDVIDSELNLFQAEALLEGIGE